MDDWGWQQLRPWIERRLQLPVGPLLCVASGSTAGRPWALSAARAQLRRLAAQAWVRRRFAPHQLRHAHAVEMARDGVSLNVIQRQLGHANLGITSVYLEGIDNAEIIDAVHARRPPMLPATAGPAPVVIAAMPSAAPDAALAQRSSRIIARDRRPEAQRLGRRPLGRSPGAPCKTGPALSPDVRDVPSGVRPRDTLKIDERQPRDCNDRRRQRDRRWRDRCRVQLPD